MDTTSSFNAFSALFPVLVYAVTEFSSALTRAHRIRLQLRFLRSCYDEQVLPRTMLPQHLLQLSDKPFDNFQRNILKKRIEIKKMENHKAFEVLKEKKRHFIYSVPADWKDVLLDHCYQRMRSVVYQQHKERLDRKLRLLIERSPWTTDSSPNCFVNLSDKQLDNNTTCALGYGLSFSTSVKPVDSVEIAKGFCMLEKNSDISSECINISKGIVYNSVQKSDTPSCPKRFMAALKDLKKDESLHITKADKSNAIVIMDKADYIEKMETLLSDVNTYSPLQKNPLECVNRHFNKKVKELLCGNSELIKKLCTTSPSLPYMYGVIKTHKPNNPARPIISAVGSASYNLSKYLVSLLNPLIGTISNSHIKNNTDLLDKLNNVDVGSDFKLISFDVVSLFTKVPIDDLLQFLVEELPDHNLPISQDVLIELIKLCVKDCKFEFNGKYYLQKFGMAMGNPLSPILSNLYMEFFEKKIMNNILPINAVWFRYVDDILCLWPVAENEHSFLTRLNELVPSIKFTMEHENDSSLPFLDCRIHRIDRKFKYSIYRKPTNISSYIHHYSSQNSKVKQSAFLSMYLRALRICSPEYLDNEMEKINSIGKEHKYPDIFLQQTLRKAKRIFYDSNPREQFNNNNLLVLPYHENFRDLPQLLKSFNVNVVFKNASTVRTMLIKNSPNDNGSCVYKIPCNMCSKFYLGQTGKGLQTRIMQHKQSIRYGQETNAIFLHLRDNHHTIDWSNAAPIAYCKNALERNVIESSLIKYSEKCNMNVSQGLYKLDSFLISQIFKKYSSCLNLPPNTTSL